MIEVDVEMLVRWAALAGFALTLFAYLHALKRDLQSELRSVETRLSGDISDVRGELRDTRTELKGDIADLRREMKGEFAKVVGRLTTLEQRTYDLSTRLPPAPARPTG